MKLEQISPFVRYARKNEMTFKNVECIAFDHRIFCVESGQAVIYLNDIPYELSANDVVYWRSGVKYRMELGENTVLSGVNFDFMNGNIAYERPLPPVYADEFKGKLIENVSFEDTDFFDNSFVLKNSFDLKNKMHEIIEEFNNRENYYRERVSALLKELLVLCIRKSELGSNDKSSKKASEIIAFIKENYHKEISNTTLAERFNYHPGYIGSIIKKHTNQSLHKYVLTYRMYVAVNLLESTEMTVGEIATAVGMSDIYHFSKTFKEIIGTSPNKFRRPKKDIR